MTLEQKIKATEELTGLYYQKDKTKESKFNFHPIFEEGNYFTYKYVFLLDTTYYSANGNEYGYIKLVIDKQHVEQEAGIRYYETHDNGPKHNTALPINWLTSLGEIWGDE